MVSVTVKAIGRGRRGGTQQDAAGRGREQAGGGVDRSRNRRALQQRDQQGGRELEAESQSAVEQS
jgi:hypothetical protein